MKLSVQILSIALLALYSIAILHNAVPHIHTSDIGSSAQKRNSPHQHDSESHSHQESENSDDWLSFLLQAMDGFSHTDLGPAHFENYVAQNEFKLNVQQGVTLLAVAYVLFEPIPACNGAPALSGHPPPVTYNSPFVFCAPERGPPSVV